MTRFFALAVCCFIGVFALAGCGTKDPSANTPSVSGVAASGAPISGQVFLKDSAVPARERAVFTRADGSFTFDASALTPPFLLKIVPAGGGSPLYSFASAVGTANINPLSNLAMVRASGSEDLASLYTGASLEMMATLAAAIPSAVSSIQAALNPTLAKFSASSFNFLSDPMAADHSGFDLFLDSAAVSVANGTVTVVDRHNGSTMQMPLASFVTSVIDLDQGASISPGAPNVAPGTTTTFSATVGGGTPVWSVVEGNGGVITTDGVYTAPAAAGVFHVQAASADGKKRVVATVTVGAAKTNLRIVAVGEGAYALWAEDLNDVAGINVTINYDSSALVNPKVTKGTPISSSLFVPNTQNAGIVRFAVVSTTPFPRSGVLAMMSFDVVGGAPQAPVITAASVARMNGTQVTLAF